MGLLTLVATAFWAMLPAYVPNNVAVVAGGGAPIDGGRTFRGARLLGDGKTWRGTAAGATAGVVLALLLNAIRPAVVSTFGVGLPVFPLPAAIGLAFGAMLGDIASSFAKRRTGRERGAPWIGVDQLDFVAGALLLASLLARSWFVGVFTLPVVAVVVVMTPVLHVATNVIGYLLGLKNEPW